MFRKSCLMQFEGLDFCILLFSEADMEAFIQFNVFSSKFCKFRSHIFCCYDNTHIQNSL